MIDSLDTMINEMNVMMHVNLFDMKKLNTYYDFIRDYIKGKNIPEAQYRYALKVVGCFTLIQRFEFVGSDKEATEGCFRKTTKSAEMIKTTNKMLKTEKFDFVYLFNCWGYVRYNRNDLLIDQLIKCTNQL